MPLVSLPQGSAVFKHQNKKIFMKYITLAIPLLVSIAGVSQPKIVDKAVIKMQTEVTFPENMTRGGGGGGGGGERSGMMGGMTGMEASSTIYYKGDMTKVESTTDFGNNVVITDRKNKKTTTLIEAMGRKTGFYATDADDEVMRARMDSMRSLRRDSLQRLGIPVGAPPKPEIIYTEETKKIAGYVCKKAIIKNPGQRNTVTETEVWYTPDFKMSPGFSLTGGSGGSRSMMSMASVNGLDEINGFPMEYKFERSNGMKMHMVVSKVQIDANIDDKIFEIPKGFDLKPMKEMQQGGRGFMMRSN
jgi:hypothetical protein